MKRYLDIYQTLKCAQFFNGFEKNIKNCESYEFFLQNSNNNKKEKENYSV